MPGPEAKAVAENAFLIEELIQANGLGLTFPSPPAEVLMHGHCHQKAFVGTEPMVSFVEKTGAKVQVVDSGCCGMAGAFGYEVEHYEISRGMAEHRLLPAIREAASDTVIVAGGISCRQQIEHGTGRRALHPAEVLRQAMTAHSDEVPLAD